MADLEKALQAELTERRICARPGTPLPQTKSKLQEQSQPPLIKDLGNNCSSNLACRGHIRSELSRAWGGHDVNQRAQTNDLARLHFDYQQSCGSNSYSWSTPTTTTTTTAAATTTTATTPTSSSSTTTTANTTTTTTALSLDAQTSEDVFA